MRLNPMVGLSPCLDGFARAARLIFYPMKISLKLMLPLVIALTQAGCVTGRRSFDVPLDKSASAPLGPTNGTFFFKEITDNRHFENHPPSPSIPSVDGDVNALSPAERSQFIGRQRNTYGHAMGDVTLPNGMTVQDKTRELLTEGLNRLGYSVVADPNAASTATVQIQEFWSWMTPGFVALSFEVTLRCQVAIVHDGKTIVFETHGYALNHGQFAKGKNWQEAFAAAFEDFLKDFSLQLKANGY
jgi:hypothetical protein